MTDAIPVHDLDMLMSLSRLGKSVYVPGSMPFRKPRPAAFMINLQGRILHVLFQRGMYIYEKGKTP